MKALFLFLLFASVSFGATRSGTTVTCDDATETEVWTNAIEGLAQTGDTVVIPDNLPTGGTFTLTFSGQTTSAIAWDANAATVDAALEALSNIGAGDVTVDDTGVLQYRVTFTGALAAADQAQITATDSLTPTGGRDMATFELKKGDNLPAVNEIQVIRMGSAWASSHILTKAIKLQGAGMDNTIILDNLTGTYWIRFDLVKNKVTEITGIAFKNGTSTSSGSIDGGSTLRFIGDSTSSPQLRVHHCKFEELMQWPVITLQVKGVFDHNIWLNCDGGGAYIYGLNWRAATPTGTEDFGDGSWAYPTNFASDDAIFYENNFFDQSGSVWDKTFFDGTRGGRGVVRYNTFSKPAAGHNAAPITCHGLEGRNRAIRHFEFYNNYITSVQSNKFTNNRGGTMVNFNNRVAAGSAGGDIFGFQCDREGDPFPWGRASGSNKYDVNDPNGGTNTAPIPFYTGVMGPTTTTDFIKVVPSPGWAVNQWAGYSVSDLDKMFPVGNINWRPEPSYLGSVIMSNTADTITTAPSGFSNPHDYADTDNFIIQRCIHAMDMVGRAGTSNAALLTGGGTNPNPPILPSGWNNEATEPLYEWNNIKLPSTDINFSSGEHAMIKSGVHYINNTVKPGYPWTANVDTICGAEDYANVPLAASATNGKGGYIYPHPLTGEAVGRIIQLEGDLVFGNTIIGEPPPVRTVTVRNVGNAILTVSSVGYTPSVFVGPTDSFDVAPGATFDVAVSFLPVAETDYSGTVTFNSNATAGTNTMAASGRGVVGTSQRPYPVFMIIKKVMSKWIP